MTAEQGLVVVGLITCVIIGWQAWETRKAADAARLSAVTGAKSLVATQRAFLCLVNFETQPFSNGFGIQPVFKNVGYTPAVRCQVRVGIIDTAADSANHFAPNVPERPDSGYPFATIGPGIEMRPALQFLSDDQVGLIIERNTVFMIQIRYQYWDVFDNTPMHETVVCSPISVRRDPRVGSPRNLSDYPFAFNTCHGGHNEAT